MLALALVGAACSSEEATPSLPDASVPADGSTLDGSTTTDSGVHADAAVADDASTIVDDCDPVAQTGCTAPDTKCVVENPEPMGGTLCVPPGTDVALDGLCTGGDCQPGLACVRTSSVASTCQQVCNFGTGTGCAALGDEFECRTRLTDTNWGVCLRLPPTCDPTTQAPCGPSLACGPYLRRSGAWEFRCRSAGTQAEGQACGSSGGGDCARGLACVRSQVTGQAACRKYCDTNSDCTAPTTCAGSVPEPAFMYCVE